MNCIPLAVIIGLALPVAALAQKRDFEFRRELAAGSRFEIHNIIGDVTLEATSGRTVDVAATKHEGRHGDPEDVDIEAIDLGGGGVAICVYYPGSWHRRSGRDSDRDDRDDRDDRRGRRRHRDSDACSRGSDWSGNHRNDTRVDFVVKVPAGLKLEAKTVSGDVIAQGLRGELELATVSGDLQLTDAQGPVLEATSVSGNVQLDKVVAREVTAETVSGDVTFVGDIDPKGIYDFKTLSGDVIVTVPRQPDATLSAATFSGRFSSDFEVTSDGRRRRNRYNATWGSGGARIDLESFSGNIRIRSAR